jgi:hypothetical protein
VLEKVFAAFNITEDPDALLPVPPKSAAARQGQALLRKLRRRFWRPSDGFSQPFFRQTSADDVMLGRF